LKPRSWYRTFLEDPRGAILVDGREIPLRAVRTRSERLKDAVSRAYLAKYDKGYSIKYARDMGRPKSRATTTELVPDDRTRLSSKQSPDPVVKSGQQTFARRNN
jgi:hypothetical protein